ncbi:hypothetical protein [Coprococcus eutactus]|nr:hypothetical protein [Coprococcus eutactus]
MDKLVGTYKPQKLYCYSKPNAMEGHNIQMMWQYVMQIHLKMR